MRSLLPLLMMTSACQFNAVERDIEHRETSLLVPSAIREVEPKADRVTVLHPSGRTTVMDRVVLRRNGDRFLLQPVDPKQKEVELAIGDIQAFEIERWTYGEEARAAVKGRRRDSDVDDTFVNVFGGVLIGAGLVTALFLSIDAIAPD